MAELVRRARMYVTSFLVFHTEANCEYWSQKCTQNGNIHSIELYVYAEKQSASNLSFILSQLKQGRNQTLMTSQHLFIFTTTTSTHKIF